MAIKKGIWSKIEIQLLMDNYIRPFAEIRDFVISKNPHLLTSKHEDLSNLADLIIEEHKLDDGITLCKSCHKNHHLENGVNCGDLPLDNAKDNPQPSLGNVIKFVPRKVQRSTLEDSQTNKSDTSAPHTIFPNGVMI